MRLALAGLQGATLGGLLTLVVLGGLRATTANAHPSGPAKTDPYQQLVARAVSDHQCSYSGFGGNQIPASALIRTSQGELRQVSFDEGWAVYNGERPGTLVAVCLDDTGGHEPSRLSDQP